MLRCGCCLLSGVFSCTSKGSCMCRMLGSSGWFGASVVGGSYCRPAPPSRLIRLMLLWRRSSVHSLRPSP
ncbi:hypothetical protein APX70_200601 [Pseudomonas syringae pv. maculicola]|uniref:Uncharacterized protein n=1 Tax=Pseudomonas syringae pv. maculicola TaxID=59511 RepID=A0A3M3ADF3_PSEYM|nr:hypothetical protein APX70_200601 [Pseudomonas syringae pv. maculicola]